MTKKLFFFAVTMEILIHGKGWNYVIQAYNRLKNEVLFLCIGSNQQGYRYENFYDVGTIYDKKLLAKYYSAADLFLYPSIADTFGLVVTESMSCGTPVISFDTGGIPEQISHMNTGYIAQQHNIDDLLNGVNIFINDDELRKKASNLSRKIVQDKFTLALTLKNYTDLYYEVITFGKD
jgi:glycosyltransferase involved in cell wall biosynthesis